MDTTLAPPGAADAEQEEANRAKKAQAALEQEELEEADREQLNAEKDDRLFDEALALLEGFAEKVPPAGGAWQEGWQERRQGLSARIDERLAQSRESSRRLGLGAPASEGVLLPLLAVLAPCSEKQGASPPEGPAGGAPPPPPLETRAALAARVALLKDAYPHATDQRRRVKALCGIF